MTDPAPYDHADDPEYVYWARMFARSSAIPVHTITVGKESADRVYEGRNNYKGWEPE